MSLDDVYYWLHAGSVGESTNKFKGVGFPISTRSVAVAGEFLPLSNRSAPRPGGGGFASNQASSGRRKANLTTHTQPHHLEKAGTIECALNQFGEGACTTHGVVQSVYTIRLHHQQLKRNSAGRRARAANPLPLRSVPYARMAATYGGHTQRTTSRWPALVSPGKPAGLRVGAARGWMVLWRWRRCGFRGRHDGASRASLSTGICIGSPLATYYYKG